MSEYIDKETLAKFIANVRKSLPHESKDFFTRDEMLLNFEQIVRATPAADVEPVRRGEWIEDDDAFNRCSECGYEQDFPEITTPYCPNCGAKMEYEEA